MAWTSVSIGAQRVRAARSTLQTLSLARGKALGFCVLGHGRGTDHSQPSGRLARDNGEHQKWDRWGDGTPGPLHPSWGPQSPHRWVGIPTIKPVLQGTPIETAGFWKARASIPGAWRLPSPKGTCASNEETFSPRNLSN